jgi:rfaE bifunctional protein kinase chain/domain
VIPARFESITGKYRCLRVAVVGDFCLDRYFEIDPAKSEMSIETGLPVHNVAQVRCQPGGAGTIVNNLAALGIGTIFPLGLAGKDGEGFELRRALRARKGVKLDYFIETEDRKTFTYSKPLLIHANKPPEELSRLDIKNWTRTPQALQKKLALAVTKLANHVDAMILLDQVDLPETGVVTGHVLDAVNGVCRKKPQLFILADSRRSLRDFPKVCFKMNRAEFSALTGGSGLPVKKLTGAVRELARAHGRAVFVTLAEQGILGALPSGEVEHQPSFPLRGPIDIVGAGDAVTANLTAALAAGASLQESVRLANAAASIVIHQLGTTGTASVQQVRGLALVNPEAA